MKPSPSPPTRAHATTPAPRKRSSGMAAAISSPALPLTPREADAGPAPPDAPASKPAVRLRSTPRCNDATALASAFTTTPPCRTPALPWSVSEKTASATAVVLLEPDLDRLVQVLEEDGVLP